MASRSFYIQVILRIALLSVTSLGIAFTTLYTPIYYALLPGYLLVQQTIWLIQYINRTNKKIAFFFESIKNEDFSFKVSQGIPEKSFQELDRRISEVNDQIQQIFLENRTQEAYFKEVLRQVDVGILSYNKEGHILFANRMVKKLLNYERLNHIRQLEALNTPLFDLLSSHTPFDRKLIEVSNERETIQLSLKSSSFKSTEGPIILLTVQDIRHELDEKETDSWIKLIKVLTHEIMNMVTPITSITEAILDNFKLQDKPVPIQQLDTKRIENTVKGLTVIKNQGKDLMSFIQSYRGFLSIANPQKKIVKVKDLFETLNILLSKDVHEQKFRVEMEINPENLELFIDRQQIIQVLVNLCQNAMHSITNSGQEDGKLQIYAGMSREGMKYIEVKDNGPGISPELIDNIFVPFFTTKDSGSGIGLSLSKQILRLHGGSLRVSSIPSESTSFYLNF